jgi:polysaccharide export outer membrane protein
MTETSPASPRRPGALARRNRALGARSLGAGAALALLVASGCRGHGAGNSTPVEEYAAGAASAEGADYRIAAGDTLAVRVWNQDAMSNARARVRDDGKISVPLLQDVDVAGTTPTELSQRLQVKLKTYMVNPVVTITVEEFRPLRVSVLGEVARPGQYDLDRGAGVLAALAAAGGLTDYANRSALYVLRSGPDGKSPVRIRFRYDALVQGERLAAGFRLHPGDLVVAE